MRMILKKVRWQSQRTNSKQDTSFPTSVASCLEPLDKQKETDKKEYWSLMVALFIIFGLIYLMVGGK